MHDGVVWRTPGNLGAFILRNTANEHVRAAYLHMNPNFMDEEGLVTGRTVSEGEIIGKVATWGDYENGTSYHLHFALQVFTRSGWTWVNPYASLVASYERLIGARGREIKPGDAAPATPDKPPVILNPSPVADAVRASRKACRGKERKASGGKEEAAAEKEEAGSTPPPQDPGR